MSFEPSRRTHVDLAGLWGKQGLADFRPPHQREPELKFRLKDKHDFAGIVTSLIEAEGHGQLHILRDMWPRKYPLISLGVETVDSDGFPTFRFAKNGYMTRFRCEINTGTGRMQKLDINVKERLGNLSEAPNGSFPVRREWEAALEDSDQITHQQFTAVHTVLRNKSFDDPLPEILRNTETRELRVKSCFMNTRFFYQAFMAVPGADAFVTFDLCHDFGYPAALDWEPAGNERIEAEAEIRTIHVRKGQIKGEDQLLLIMDSALNQMTEFMTRGADVTLYTESKLEYADHEVGNHYSLSRLVEGFRKVSGDVSRVDETRYGLAMALMQNQTPQHVISRVKPMQYLAEMLPRAEELQPVPLPVFRPGQFVPAVA